MAINDYPKVQFQFKIDYTATLLAMPYDVWYIFNYDSVNGHAFKESANRLTREMGDKWEFKKLTKPHKYMCRVRRHEYDDNNAD